MSSADPARSDRFIDLSHTVKDGLVTYPGLPAPAMCDYLSREESRERYVDGVEFQIGRIDMVSNTGTYIDSPFHRYEGRKDLSQLDLERIADVEAVVVRARGADRAIDAGALAALGIDLAGKAVLVDTGFSQYFGTPRYFEGHPFLTEAAARFLVDARVALVGIDSLNIDDVADLRRPVHSLVLGADIPIVEHMTGLDRLPDTGARFFAVPVKIRGFGTFPVRAFAIAG